MEEKIENDAIAVNVMGVTMFTSFITTATAFLWAEKLNKEVRCISVEKNKAEGGIWREEADLSQLDDLGYYLSRGNKSNKIEHIYIKGEITTKDIIDKVKKIINSCVDMEDIDSTVLLYNRIVSEFDACEKGEMVIFDEYTKDVKTVDRYLPLVEKNNRIYALAIKK